MNLLILVGLVGVCFALMWVVQTVVLVWHGQAPAWPLRYDKEFPAVRWTGKILVQVVWAILLIGFPLAIGEDCVTYFSARLPNANWPQIAALFVVTLGLFGLIYATEIALAWVAVTPQFDTRTRRGKLFRRFLTPVPLALVEESVFRGIVLDQFLEVLPANVVAVAVAIVVSSALFSAVHFLRRTEPSISIQRAATGLFVVGCVLGVAYVAGGRSLWFPVAIHAAGILVVEVMRLYTTYRAKPSLIGYPTFPHSGAVGLATLLLLCMIVIVFFSQAT